MDRVYEMKEGSFQANFLSLYQFSCPKWFRDAKFGIWSHWGPQSVPMYGDWYARNMYLEGTDQYLYHVRTFGHPSKFGYKDIIKLWKAEAFEPERLMKLYRRAGAKYFVAQAMHHDHFFNFDSKRNPYNSVNMGPRKDIVGLWKEAAKKENMYFGLSEHHGACFEWFNTNKLCDKKGPYVNVPYDGNDPAYRDFYLDNADTVQQGHIRRHYTWNEKWYPVWYEDVREAVDRYEPELLYSDGALPFYRKGATTEDETYLPGLSMAAHLYNSSEARYGENQAVYLHKDGREEFYRIGLLDFERRADEMIRKDPWQTDTCLGNWFYDVRAQYKDARQVTDLLIDVVSKNGNLLLNIPQRPDGTIDKECQFILEEIAKWMQICQEGIFETRPYEIYGEGSTTIDAEKKTIWTENDIRYTKKNSTVYAFVMGDTQHVVLRKLIHPERVKSVKLLGYGDVSFENRLGILHAKLPEKLPSEFANCLKIEF